MKAGKYRNTLGAELILTEPFTNSGNILALGEIWWAESTGGFFNQRWLVTRDGLEETNYEFVDN